MKQTLFAILFILFSFVSFGKSYSVSCTYNKKDTFILNSGQCICPTNDSVIIIIQQSAKDSITIDYNGKEIKTTQFEYSFKSNSDFFTYYTNGNILNKKIYHISKIDAGSNKYELRDSGVTIGNNNDSFSGYLWKGISDSTIPNPRVSPSVTTTYILKYSVDGCPTYQTVVTVFQPLTAKFHRVLNTDSFIVDDTTNKNYIVYNWNNTNKISVRGIYSFKFIPSKEDTILYLKVKCDDTACLRLSTSSESDSIYTGYTESYKSFSFSDSTVSINTLESKTNIKVYPTIFQNSVTISSTNINSASGYINVYDIQGKVVFTKKYNFSNDFKEIIDLSNISNGQYIIKVSSLYNTWTSKIIKN